MRTKINVKADTKKAQEIINTIDKSIERYGFRTLYDCYERPSAEKVSSYNDILEWLKTAPVTLFFKFVGVVSYNQNFYSVALKTYDNQHYMLITARNIYIIDRDDNIASNWLI